MAVASVQVSIHGTAYYMQYDPDGKQYKARLLSPVRTVRDTQKYSYYPVAVYITDEAGNVTIKTVTDAVLGDDLMLIVREQSIFPLKFILADPNGKELGFVNASKELDIEVGGENDFQLTVSYKDWSQEMYGIGNRLYAPDTEYGGLIEERKTSTKNDTIELLGYTWRGLLSQKVIEPPPGLAYLTVSGEANHVIASVVGDCFGSLFEVDTADSGLEINYQFDRYTDLLSGLDKMLATVGAKLQVIYKQSNGASSGHVQLGAVPVIDWSDKLEYGQDSLINFTTRDNRRGINHLICLGRGELAARLVIHLYMQPDDTISDTPYYTGAEDRTAVFDFSSAEDAETLRKQGVKRLKELKNSQEIKMSLTDIDMELGDVIGGRDRITGLILKQPVTKKTLNISGNKETIQYKVGGD